MLVVILARLNLEQDQMDAVTASLQGVLKKKFIWNNQQDLKMIQNQVGRLNKLIYGLKRASRVWNAKLGMALLNAVLKVSAVGICIYYIII